jgi:hypothetical protein
MLLQASGEPSPRAGNGAFQNTNQGSSLRSGAVSPRRSGEGWVRP